MRSTVFLPRLLLVLAALALLSACSGLPPVQPEPDHFKVSEGAEGRRFRTLDDLTLFGQWWGPDGSPKAVVLLVHGTGTHSGFFAQWANNLSANGYAVFGIDLRGWGQSQGYGRRGYVQNYDEYVDDIVLAYREIHFRYPTKPVYIQGDSLGADVALLAVIADRIPAAGLILQAPAVKPDPGYGWFRVGGFSVAAYATLGRMMPNTGMIPMGTYAELAFDDPAVRKHFNDDPLCTHAALPAQYLIAMEEASDRILEHLSNIKIPLVIIHGGKDNMVPVDSSQLVMRRLGSEDKSLWIYDNMSHESMHDSDHERVWTDIIGWLDGHVAKAAEATAHDVAPTSSPGINTALKP